MDQTISATSVSPGSLAQSFHFCGPNTVKRKKVTKIQVLAELESNLNIIEKTYMENEKILLLTKMF